MKTRALSLLSASLILLPLAGSHAAPPKKKGPPAAPAEDPSPGKALAPYIEKLDVLLALHTKGPAPFRDQAPGHLVVLRQRFATARAAATGDDTAKFDAAIATCDAITGAIEERERTASQISASGTVSGGALNDPARKDVLNQGVRGGDFAKAVGEVQEGKREQAEKRDAHRATAATDNSLTAMAVNRWNQRAIDLRKKITASYARIVG